MTQLYNLTVEQLRKAVAIKEQIETLQGEIEAMTGVEGGSPASVNAKGLGRKKMSPSERGRVAVAARWAKARAAQAEAAPKKRGKFSAAHRAALKAAQKARWAKIKGNGASESKPEKKGKRRLSKAGRAAIIAGTKARWAKIRAAKAEAAPKKPAK